MRRYHALLLLVVVLAALSAALLVPRSSERLAMLMRDGDTFAALAEARRQAAAGDRSAATLARLADLERRAGEPRAALAILAAHLARTPRDVAARDLEAETLLDLGDIDGALAARAKAFATDRTSARGRTLAALYRAHGRFEAELDHLARLAADGLAGTGELHRLGARLAAAGRPEEAARALAEADRATVAGDGAHRLLLLDCLVAAGRIDEAAARALHWIALDRQPHLVAEAAVRLAAAGATAPVQAIARQSAAVLPEAALQIVGEVGRRGHTAAARAMLASLADVSLPASSRMARDFVAIAAASGEPGAGLALLRRLARDRAPPALQAELAEQLAFAFGRPVLEALPGYLAREAAAARPLLGAEIALAAADHMQARRLAATIDRATLSGPEQARWIALVEGLGEADATLHALLAEWRDRGRASGAASLLLALADRMQRSDLQSLVLAASAPERAGDASRR